jgi:NAD(P)H-dependent FMN reductase
VTAEYNRSITASLKNAIDHLFNEWGGKPAAIVSYGYIDGGGSATKNLKDILAWVKLDVVEPQVSVQLTQDTFAEDGSFKDIDATLADAKAPFLAALEAINKA